MRVLERLPRETGRDYALRVLKENIINLELAPGSQVSENELAAELGLSRTPVREAIIDLSKVKIVEVHPQRKSLVSLIDYELVDESRFMRKHLERAVVELDCEMAAPEDIQRLEKNVQLEVFYLEHDVSEQLWLLDNQFHEMLFEIAHKTQLFQMMQTLSIHFDRVRKMSLNVVRDKNIIQDHADLVRAIAGRNVEEALVLTDKHLTRYKIDAIALRKKYPQYFAN